MLVSNHPSKNIQPILTVGLFSRAYITGPLKYGPYSVADKKNFYDRWFFLPIRCRIIPVNRDNPQDDECLRITREVAEERSNLIWYPEGTRTWKGKKFNYSPKGKKISQLKSGFARIVSEFDYTVIPVWCDIKWYRVTLTIGEPLTNLGGQDKKKIVQLTTDALLTLADAS
jgi:1-acyl-sn-glycerol-3-phosphate acyltransferase